MASSTKSLHELARLFGVEASYTDVWGRPREAEPDSLLKILRTLGASVSSLRDVPDALRERRLSFWRQGVDPVVVAWLDRPTTVEYRSPLDQDVRIVDCVLTLEDGTQQCWRESLNRLPPLKTEEVEGQRYVARQLSLPEYLPAGYHRLRLECRGIVREILVLAAPVRAYDPREKKDTRSWGVFLPLYAIPSRENWGIGNFSDLQSMLEWSRELGADVVATLPLLAAFLDQPCEPSPYAPLSRLFWNEIYLDVASLPEFDSCTAAKNLVHSQEFNQHIENVRGASLVDYRRVMGLKFQVLRELSQVFFEGESTRLRSLQEDLKSEPELGDYACFRAVCQRQQTPWPQWPERLQKGHLGPDDYDLDVQRTWLYAQWSARTQIAAVENKGRLLGSGLYLDLPLGVHPHGYDSWREQESFAEDASVGAPPDAGFPKGQDWGFFPLHPQHLRQSGYRYLRGILGHHCSLARWLRIDHVMGLHRLYWIPQGFPPGQGVYVNYPVEELYAVLNLESHRHQCAIVGEDLGTVPAYVGPTMNRHNLNRMYVLQYELDSALGSEVQRASMSAVASINTHDMPPFAAYWKGEDIEYRLAQGLITADYAREEEKKRQAAREYLLDHLRSCGALSPDSTELRDVLHACLTYLSSGPARLMLVNLEDLWLETRPQNIPGTTDPCPNWRQKARLAWEDIQQNPQVLDLLRVVHEMRTMSGVPR